MTTRVFIELMLGQPVLATSYNATLSIQLVDPTGLPNWSVQLEDA